MHTLLSYTGPSLDRAAHRRTDSDWLAARPHDSTTRVVPLWRGRCLVREGEPPALAAIIGVAAAEMLDTAETVVFLGQSESETAWFAADLSHLDADCLPASVKGAAFMELRAIGGLFSPPDGGIAAYARALLHWHCRHRFCGSCGAPTVACDSGHVRVCTDASCGERQFPRTDPVVIMLITCCRGGIGACLLGRQATWPKGLVSTLAGFVEPGETLENAVAREVREEVGLEVTKIDYRGSQPWPFPCSLMLAFRAETDAGADICVDNGELEDAGWFSCEDIEDLAARGRHLPQPGTIARALVEDWLQDEAAPRPAAGRRHACY